MYRQITKEFNYRQAIVYFQIYEENSLWHYILNILINAKGGSRTGAPGARPPFTNFFALVFVNFEGIFGGLVFVNFDGITRIYFHCRQQHAVFTISILSSAPTTKTQNMCERASNSQNPFSDPKNSTASGPRPTALIFLDPPLNAVTYFEHCYNSQFFIQNDKMGSYICFASCTRRLVIFLGLDFRSTLACVYMPLSFWHNVKESGV